MIKRVLHYLNKNLVSNLVSKEKSKLIKKNVNYVCYQSQHNEKNRIYLKIK